MQPPIEPCFYNQEARMLLLPRTLRRWLISTASARVLTHLEHTFGRVLHRFAHSEQAEAASKSSNGSLCQTRLQNADYPQIVAASTATDCMTAQQLSTHHGTLVLPRLLKQGGIDHG